MEGKNSPEALCIFEDDRYPYFFPISLNKPLFEMMLGSQTLRERICSELGFEQQAVICRSYLSPVLAKQYEISETTSGILINEIPGTDILFINTRLLSYGDELREMIGQLGPDSLLQKNGVTVAARLSHGKALRFLEDTGVSLGEDSVQNEFIYLKKFLSEGAQSHEPTVEQIIDKREKLLSSWCLENGISCNRTEARLLSYYWQLITENSACLIDDFQKNPLRGASPESELFKGVNLINEDDIFIGSEVEVRSGTVLDASTGPIMVDDGVSIEPNSIIYGPCYIGKSSIIRGGARVGKGSTIGNDCRIGGEVGETIISPYTNKQHSGFLGHSYIGSWVNLGAGSCNSDLKNNYSKVKAWNAGRVRETGRRFLGVVTGDHVKVAINSRINTGSVIGFCSNVVSSGFPPRFIPSFIWQTEPEMVEYELSRAIKTAEIMMDRRNVVFTAEMAELFKVLERFCRLSGRNV